MAAPLLTAETAKSILEGHTHVSLDLGLSRVEVAIDDECARLPGGAVVGLEDLRRIADREDSVFFPEGGALRQVSSWYGRFYKLVPTRGAPTLEIDGVRMHRTKGTTPEADAAEKVGALGISGGRVLDTCAGLGYTAIEALRKGCGLVVSIELSPEVLRIARMNPWSRGLFTDGRVHLLIGDSHHLVDSLTEDFFDYIIHDPPRFAHAGQLYGEEFYADMHRALRAGGRLFHYTGEPGSRFRRVDVMKGVMRRLRGVGFRRLRYHEETMGVICEKIGR
jgi:hypothetical protein